LLGIGNIADPEKLGLEAPCRSRELKANALYKRDVEYVVKDGEVIIVDEFTGRMMPGRRWSDGLHQAVESKEGVKVERENQTPGHHHLPELFPHVQKIGWHDRYRGNRST